MVHKATKTMKGFFSKQFFTLTNFQEQHIQYSSMIQTVYLTTKDNNFFLNFKHMYTLVCPSIRHILQTLRQMLLTFIFVCISMYNQVLTSSFGMKLHSYAGTGISISVSRYFISGWGREFSHSCLSFVCLFVLYSAPLPVYHGYMSARYMYLSHVPLK